MISLDTPSGRPRRHDQQRHLAAVVQELRRDAPQQRRLHAAAPAAAEHDRTRAPVAGGLDDDLARVAAERERRGIEAGLARDFGSRRSPPWPEPMLPREPEVWRRASRARSATRSNAGER